MHLLTQSELKNLLDTNIPLSSAMGVEVQCVEKTLVSLSAPLQQNSNHLGTVFGGSASALAILAAWSLLQVKLSEQQLSCEVIIQRNTMEYRHPIPTEMTAICQFDDSERWTRFMRTLERHGRARLSLHSDVSSRGHSCASLDGEFVALLQRLID